ncbi:MAG: hypothetical protein ACW98F_08190 [Candidatus Hodarchaeales archaeon]|jgi:hypothetical protein
MSIKAIDYENLEEGDLITWYGVHVLKWEDEISPYGIEPTMAFVQDDTQDELITQLLKALKELCNEIRNAHVDSNHLVPGCAVCDALNEAEQAIALAEGE